MEKIQESVESILESRNAVVTNDHFVYKGQDHGNAFVNKDAVTPHVHDLKVLASMIANKISEWGAEATIAPPMGAIKLGDRVAEELARITGYHIPAVYAEKMDETVAKVTSRSTIDVLLRKSEHLRSVHFSLWAPEGAEIIIRHPGLVIKRGQEELIRGKRVVIVEDIVNTGLSVGMAIRAAEACGADVIGVACICNRGGIEAYNLGVNRFAALLRVQMDRFPAQECPLCRAGVPINTKLGHGKEFLEQRGTRGKGIEDI